MPGLTFTTGKGLLFATIYLVLMCLALWLLLQPPVREFQPPVIPYYLPWPIFGSLAIFHL